MGILLFFLKLISYLPLKVQYFLGRIIGKILYSLKIRHKVISANIAFCYPKFTHKEQGEMIQKNYLSLGKSIIEVGLIWFQSYEKYQCKITAKNIENYHSAKKSNGKILLLGYHTNHIELILIHLSKVVDIGALYRPNDNLKIDALIQNARNKHLTCISKFNTRTAIKWLTGGHDLFITPDQDHGTENTFFVPFFDNEVATINSPIRISKMTNAAIVPVAYSKTSDNEMEIEFLPQVALTGNDYKDLSRMNEILEAAINKAPEQYYWVHRRFKTLPEGQESIY